LDANLFKNFNAVFMFSSKFICILSKGEDNMTQKKPYTIITDMNMLYFRTHSYEADKESMLHKGIYNYEMASILSAMMLAGTAYVILALYLKVTVILYIASTLMFIIAFVGLRKFIFRERDLEIVFDKTMKVATLSRG
jgi:hypothetical protein